MNDFQNLKVIVNEQNICRNAIPNTSYINAPNCKDLCEFTSATYNSNNKRCECNNEFTRIGKSKTNGCPYCMSSYGNENSITDVAKGGRGWGIGEYPYCKGGMAKLQVEVENEHPPGDAKITYKYTCNNYDLNYEFPKTFNGHELDTHHYINYDDKSNERLFCPYADNKNNLSNIHTPYLIKLSLDKEQVHQYNLACANFNEDLTKTGKYALNNSRSKIYEGPRKNILLDCTDVNPMAIISDVKMSAGNKIDNHNAGVKITYNCRF